MAAHLTSDRPRHRREALLRLLALKTPPAGDMKAIIEKLLIMDLFEEVRAAALQVLDAADPAQRPGSARLLAFRNDPQIKDWQKDPQVVRQWDGIVETLRVLPADQAKASLEHALSGTPDPKLLLMYCDLARRLHLPIPRLTDLALEAVAKSGGRSPYAFNPERYTDIEYLALTVWQDPRIFPVLLAAHPWCDAVPLSAMKLAAEGMTQLWQTPTTWASVNCPPSVDGKVVLVGGPSRSVLLDAATGKELATYEGKGPFNEGHTTLTDDWALLHIDGSHGNNDFVFLSTDPAAFSAPVSPGWVPPHPPTTAYHNKCMTFPVVEGRLFMRGHDGVYCYDLRAKP